MAFQYVLPLAVTSQLDSLRRRVRQVAFLRGCGLFLTLSCGLLVAVMLVDFLLDLTPGHRLIGFVGFCLAEVALFGTLLVRPSLIRLRDAELALLAEENFPELGERVSSLVELSDPTTPEADKGSPLMRELLEEETVRELARCDFNAAVATRPAFRRLGFGLGTLSFLMLSLLIFPSVSRLLLARLFNPWGNYESVSQLIFEIDGADEYIARGSDVEIVARLNWRNGSDEPVPEPIELAWQSDDGDSDVRRLSFDAELAAFTTTIPDLQDSFEFLVSSAGSRSKRYRINVLNRPDVLQANLEIVPPGYLGRPRESIDGVTGEITVFEHSQLTFGLSFSQPVSDASIEWVAPLVLPESELAGVKQIAMSEEDTASPDNLDEAVRREGAYANSLVPVDNLPLTHLTISQDGLSAKLQIPATIQGAFAFRLKEGHGIENDDEPHRQFIITRDQPPILDVPGSQQDRARPTDVYGMRVSAVDDIALEELELHITSREGLNRIERVPVELLGKESLDHEFRIDLADIAVQSGDFLKLQIRAVDGRPVPAPNEVWSEARYVAISDDASPQGTSDVLARQQEIRQEIQELRDQLRESVKQSDELKEDAQESLKAGRPFAQQNAVETLANREEELAARIAELADKFSQHPLFGNLSEDLWQLAADQLDPAATELRESLAENSDRQIATLDNNSTVADAVEERLAEVGSRFDDLADLEEDLLELGRIAQRARQLADDAVQLEERVEELAKAEPLAGESAEDRQDARAELAENEQLLLDEQSELLATLDHLLQQRPELLQAARDHQLERLVELAERASQIAEPQELLAESFAAQVQQLAEVQPPLPPATAENSQPSAPEDQPANAAENPAVQPARSEPVGEPTASPTIDELLAQQEELTALTAQLALQTAQQAGAESPATEAATQAAQQSAAAETSAQGGQFEQAADNATASEQAAQAAADALLEAAPALAEQAQQLAERQRQMAAAFEQLENSRTARAAAQQTRQEQLAAQSSEIAQALEELAGQLASEPLDLQEQGQQAASAQQSARQGQQAAGQAAEDLRSGNQTEAAQSAQQAAEALRAAAQQAGANATPSNNPSPVPGEFATQITDAMRQLREAQRQLAQSAAETANGGSPADEPAGQPDRESGQPTSEPGQPGASTLDAATGEPAASEAATGEPASGKPATGEAANGESPSGQPSQGGSEGQPGEPGSSPSGQPGSSGPPGPPRQKSSLADAAEALQQAAEMLSSAAQQLAADGQPSGDSQGQSNQEPSDAPGARGNSGTGAFAIGESQGAANTELKRRAMRNWGKLPRNLKTEILQSSQRKANGDYAKLIKLYFEELGKAGQSNDLDR